MSWLLSLLLRWRARRRHGVIDFTGHRGDGIAFSGSYPKAVHNLPLPGGLPAPEPLPVRVVVVIHRDGDTS